jgi:ABC-type phosphate/phosphonate transport system substrate-binding protein
MIASFRMYGVGRAMQAWRALFARVFAEAGIEVGTIEHRWPAPIAELWAMPDLCCDFMCGWPFARSRSGMQAVAAPVPSPPRYGGLPRYCSEFLVREASGWHSLEETFGARIGWMAEDSQSGFNAPRAYLARFASRDRPTLFAESKGPFGSPVKALDALRAEEVDVVALDSFFLDLCRHHEPGKVAGLRAVASTPWTPMPLLVAAPGIDSGVVGKLREILLRAHETAGYAPLLAEVLLERFVAADVGSYSALVALEREALDSGYARIA